MKEYKVSFCPIPRYNKEFTELLFYSSSIELEEIKFKIYFHWNKGKETHVYEYISMFSLNLCPRKYILNTSWSLLMIKMFSVILNPCSRFPWLHKCHESGGQGRWSFTSLVRAQKTASGRGGWKGRKNREEDGGPSDSIMMHAACGVLVRWAAIVPVVEASESDWAQPLEGRWRCHPVLGGARSLPLCRRALYKGHSTFQGINIRLIFGISTLSLL